MKIPSFLKSEKVKNTLGYWFLVGSFFLLDAFLRYKTRWSGQYSLIALPPNLFSLLWSLLLTSAVTAIPSKKWGRAAYGLVYFAWTVYTLVQLGAWLILGEFLYVSDMLYAGEGAGYAGWAATFITPALIAQVAVLIAVGIVGICFFPAGTAKCRDRLTRRGITALLCVYLIGAVPELYGTKGTENAWNDFAYPAFEYQRFSNPNFGMEITGVYQFLVRDIQVQVERATADHSQQISRIDAFFEEKADHRENAMTGLLAGKNLIVVMMESMDDWVITPEDTPTLYRMQQESIRFTQFYTPAYSSGYTFNTEFAFNTSVYPYSNGNAAYALSGNRFSDSLASAFREAGYRAESFHVGDPSFYNRSKMHQAFGYGNYNCYWTYASEEDNPRDDRFLAENDGLYSALVAEEPFYSYVITYSLHLPYTTEDELVQVALESYPQYDVQENREVSLLRAKARLTDDMFARLLRRLEEDGILEDTVILAFADHYSYGLTDKALLQQLSEEAGNEILENTPAFLYCPGLEARTVDKVMQTTDLAPTLMNLFGLEVSDYVMGQDVFDESNRGIVVFANGSWLTAEAYMREGSLVWNHGLSQEEILEINSYVNRIYEINDAILDTDYYRNRSTETTK